MAQDNAGTTTVETTVDAPVDPTADNVRSLLHGLPSLKGPYAVVDWAAFPATPHDAFLSWLCDAIRQGGVPEPHAMTLSTVDADGRPDARVVILKNVDARGWHFAAKAESAKGRQLSVAHGKDGCATAGGPCALTFYWPHLGRQVRIRGDARPRPPADCAADFLARPLASRISALASRQSAVMDENDAAVDRNQLAAETQRARALLAANPDYAPPGWLVYAVMPLEVEFWQGATDRQHGRLRYVRGVSEDAASSGGLGHWQKERLWP